MRNNQSLKTYKCIKDPLETLDDLINVATKYETEEFDKYTYNFDLSRLCKLKPLEDLQKMVGLKHIKEQIISHILFYLQNLENKNTDYLHTVIKGPPGVGKPIS